MKKGDKVVCIFRCAGVQSASIQTVSKVSKRNGISVENLETVFDYNTHLGIDVWSGSMEIISLES